MLKQFTRIVIVFFMVNYSYAKEQSTKIGSLKDYKTYHLETNFTKKAELLELLLNSGLDENEFDLFQSEVEKIIDYARKNNDLFLLNYARFMFSYVNYTRGEYDLSLVLTRSSLAYFSENGNSRLMGFLYRDMGIISEGLRENILALEYFSRSQKYFKECNMHMEYVHSRALEAKILIHFKEFRKAEKILKGCIFHMKSYKKYRTVFGYYNFLSDLYAEQGNTTMVQFCNKKSSEFAMKSGSLSAIALSKNNLAIEKFYEGDIESSLKYFNEALETRIEMNKTKLISESYYNIATVYMSTSAYEKAREYFEKSLVVSKSNDFLQETADAYLALSEVYEKTMDYNNALRLNKKYLVVKEKLYLDGVKQAKNLSLKINKFENDSKEAGVINSKHKGQKKRIFQDAILAILITGYVVLLGLFLSRKRNKLIIN